MDIKSIIDTASRFTYPTKEELESANKLFTDIPIFEYEYISDREAIMSPDHKLAHKKNHLYNWNFCLQNKLAKLRFAYTNSIVFYNRGIPTKNDKPDSDLHINQIQFNFYSETFYYFLFSVRDIILQIINVYFDLGFEENRVYQGRIIKRLRNQPVNKILIKYSKQLEDSEKIRQTFTHRFPVNEPDYRSSYREVTYEPSRDILVKIKQCLPDKSQVNNPNNGTSHTVKEFGVSAGFSKGKELNEIYDDMIKASAIMSKFIQDLKEVMKPI